MTNYLTIFPNWRELRKLRNSRLRDPLNHPLSYQNTIEPGKRGGKPCIRGMRITVYDVLEYLASGMSQEEILKRLSLPYEGRHPCLSKLCP
jgi:hypothetical protein